MTQPRNTSLKRAAGQGLARLIKLVEHTSTIVFEPTELKERLRAQHPVIVATWHGQFMMTACLHPRDIPVAAMVARHGDAEVIGEAMAAFDVELIRGAGAGERKKDRGGAHALRAALTALKGRVEQPPVSLVMTADVPPGPARIAGAGIITLARLSGRPILPVASATSRYKAFKTWSRVTVNLPYGKLAFVGGPAIHVPRDADEAQLEALRVELEASLNAVTARAYALAGTDPTRATPPNAASGPIRPGLLLKTYGGLTSAARPLVGPLLRHREKRGKEDGARLMERRGVASIARPSGLLIWVHAASVGETNAVLPLIAALRGARPDVKVLLTTTTVTSARLAVDRLPMGTMHQYVPFDAPSYAAQFLDHWRPNMVLFTESEIWPNLILAIGERRISLGLVNARMSPKSYKSWQRLSGISGPLFSRFSVILAQNEKLARWFRDVGGRVVVPVGNLKADAPPPPVDAAKLDALLGALGHRPRLLAASTHEGEEVIVAEAHAVLAAQYPEFCTLIAPRHPERGPQIADELTALGYRIALRSRGEPLTAQTQIYVADTIGELGTLFSTVPIVFMGGSLIDRGGQNPLEAVSHGAAVLTGPSVHNFRDEYRALEAAGGSASVQDGATLAACVLELMRVPAKRETMVAVARASADRLKGALARTVATLLPLLPPAALVAAPEPVEAALSVSFKNAS